MLRKYIVVLALLSVGTVFAGTPPVESSKSTLGPKLTVNAELETKAAETEVTNTEVIPDTAPNAKLATVLRWNQIAIDASGLDHTPLRPGESRIFGEQIGPGRSARAIAIVQIAVFEAMNAIGGQYQSYVGMPKTSTGPAVRAAIAQAARDTLVVMFPSQKATFDAALDADLKTIANKYNRNNGVAIGAKAAAKILALRSGDGAEHAEPYMDIDFVPSQYAGKWRQDPVSLVPLALGAHWGKVQPFVLKTPEQFRVPPPPSMESEEYAQAYAEVLRLGGDGITTPTERTQEQTFIGTFWAYDGTPSLCAPPRLYNQIATTIALNRGSNAMQVARLLALVNVAMADAGIASWESKYYYQFWRPITAIREADVGMGPTGSGDGNAQTIADPTFMPLGAPASNLVGPNFTPPFPAYPSGHATFGGALFQVLRRFYRTDDIAFTFVSDEYNGRTIDHTGVVRPLIPRTFASLSQAEEENGQSRIYLGIHWAFDKTEGLTQGEQIGDYVVDRIFLPQK
jgi:hypothetical protein